MKKGMNIIILCHGNWGKVLVEEAEKMFGLTNSYSVVPLFPENSVDGYREAVETEIIKAADNIVLVSDIYGGTTSNTGLYFGIKYKVPVISGLGLQLLLDIDRYGAVEDVKDFISSAENHGYRNLVEDYKKIKKAEE